MYLVMCETAERVYPECLLRTTEEFARWKAQRRRRRGEEVFMNTRTSLVILRGSERTTYTLEYIKEFHDHGSDSKR